MSFKLLDPLGNWMRWVPQFCREGARRVGHIRRNRSGYIINLLLLYVGPSCWGSSSVPVCRLQGTWSWNFGIPQSMSDFLSLEWRRWGAGIPSKLQWHLSPPVHVVYVIVYTCVSRLITDSSSPDSSYLSNYVFIVGGNFCGTSRTRQRDKLLMFSFYKLFLLPRTIYLIYWILFIFVYQLKYYVSIKPSLTPSRLERFSCTLIIPLGPSLAYFCTVIVMGFSPLQ